ncbi:dTMP kinase [Gordonia alkaliphila]|uniref:dTMP kinase n=1 Tax=Gordonia alkaliphila TaxID=1053547 RepID=UPI001FF3C489|nr:dTMP kinase [Gordonia alkaliphila]MCK0438313.1 dTMP kinase [Gordonia alkaliphila]
MGILVAIEGLDGAGKNTIVGKFHEAAAGRAMTITSTSFPSYGSSVEADLAAEALHGEHGDLSSSAYAMALLFALDRRRWAQWLRRACDEHDLVLCDRYVASNAAYSAARLHQGPDGAVVRWVADLEFTRFGLPVPDHQLLLGVPPEIAMERAQGRADDDAGRAKDAYERDADLQTRVYRSYLDLVDAHWISPWTVADGDAAVHAILDLVP